MTWRPAGEDDHRRSASIRAALVTLRQLTAKLNATEDTRKKDLLESHRQQVIGFLKEAAEQAAQQINQDITPAPPGPVQRSSVRGAGVEQDAPEAVIQETLLDFLENPSKLLVPEISPAIMPKEGEQPAPDPGEYKTQPERIGVPFRGTETLFRRDDEQAVPNRVAELERQLAERDRQLAEARQEQVELKQQLTEERQKAQQTRTQLAEVQVKLERYEAKQERRQELANERLKRWRERNPDRVREQNTQDVRAYRARKRQQGS